MNNRENYIYIFIYALITAISVLMKGQRETYLLLLSGMAAGVVMIVRSRVLYEQPGKWFVFFLTLSCTNTAGAGVLAHCPPAIDGPISADDLYAAVTVNMVIFALIWLSRRKIMTPQGNKTAMLNLIAYPLMAILSLYFR